MRKSYSIHVSKVKFSHLVAIFFQIRSCYKAQVGFELQFFCLSLPRTKVIFGLHHSQPWNFIGMKSVSSFFFFLILKMTSSLIECIPITVSSPSTLPNYPLFNWKMLWFKWFIPWMKQNCWCIPCHDMCIHKNRHIMNRDADGILSYRKSLYFVSFHFVLFWEFELH